MRSGVGSVLVLFCDVGHGENLSGLSRCPRVRHSFLGSKGPSGCQGTEMGRPGKTGARGCYLFQYECCVPKGTFVSILDLHLSLPEEPVPSSWLGQVAHLQPVF